MLVGLAVVGSAMAKEPAGVVELTVDVPAPESVKGKLREATREEIAKEVVKRIRTRVEAAEVKFQSVRMADNSTIEITADGDIGRELLVGIALPPGSFEFRPVKSAGADWLQLIGEMPPGVELRQGEKLDEKDAFVFSESRSKLESFISKISLSEYDVHVFSTKEGWRTVALGEPAFSQENVRSGEIRQVQTGAPYVSLEVDGDGTHRFEAIKTEHEGRFAAVLDGEVVSVVEGSAFSGGTLNLSAPENLSGKESLMRWARQVAGRLASPIPVKLIPIED